MARYEDYFDSKYLTAADLNGHEVKVVIDRLEDVEFKDGSHKPALFFISKRKGMVLNKTNAGKLKAQFGGDMNALIGKEVTLYPDVTDFQGKPTECLRLRPVLPTVNANGPDDKIPF